MYESGWPDRKGGFMRNTGSAGVAPCINSQRTCLHGFLALGGCPRMGVEAKIFKIEPHLPPIRREYCPYLRRVGGEWGQFWEFFSWHPILGQPPREAMSTICDRMHWGKTASGYYPFISYHASYQPRACERGERGRPGWVSCDQAELSRGPGQKRHKHA